MLPCAYWFSYKRRSADNWYVKLALALGAVLAIVAFFSQLGSVQTLDEIRFPLAEIFLWIQVLHSFDLPERKDLHFSLGSSLALMGVAGSLAQTMSYAPFVVVYFALALCALHLAQVSEAADGTVATLRPEPGARRPQVWSQLARTGAGIAAAGVVLYLLTPQSTGVRTLALPFSLGNGAGIAAGEVAVQPRLRVGWARLPLLGHRLPRFQRQPRPASPGRAFRRGRHEGAQLGPRHVAGHDLRQLRRGQLVATVR